MSAPTTLTVTYISALPSTTSTITVQIPKPDNTNPLDFTVTMRNISLNGGLWFVNASGVEQFIPASQIFSVTAQ